MAIKSPFLVLFVLCLVAVAVMSIPRRRKDMESLYDVLKLEKVAKTNGYLNKKANVINEYNSYFYCCS